MSADFIIRLLEIAKGDDLQRARFAFRHYSPEEMNKPHGESGKTRAEIIAAYEAHEAKIDSAIAWVRAK